MLFDRRAGPERAEKLARKELDGLRSDGESMPEMFFRVPSIPNFPNFSGRYSERDLETALLRDIEALLLKMRSGSSFAGRQKRMVIDGPDHTLGLFSDHRRLRRLVAVELKLGRSKRRAQATEQALPRRTGREGTGIEVKALPVRLDPLGRKRAGRHRPAAVGSISQDCRLRKP